MTAASQHTGLSPERWASFPFARQILIIGNEMNRAAKLMDETDGDRRRSAYERVLNLTDLTIAAAPRRAARRELLRWRDLVAVLFVAVSAQPREHAAAFRALLLLNPEAAHQIPHVLGDPPR